MKKYFFLAIAGAIALASIAGCPPIAPSASSSPASSGSSK